MLAAHDQENRVFPHHAAANNKQQQLQPKTPGARFPKTPLKVPLNDENATRGLGGKSVLTAKGGNENVRTIGKGKGLDKSNLLTPMGKKSWMSRPSLICVEDNSADPLPVEPRTARAPLGNRTTNAKTGTVQAGGVKGLVREFEKTQEPRSTARRPRIKSPQTESFRLEVHNDKNGPLGDEEDIEYAPPRPREAPYQSDVFPDGVLTFDGLKPENRLKGYYQYYYNPIGEDGMSLKERQFIEQQQRAFKNLDDQIQKDMDEFDWTIGDIPGSKDFLKKKQSTTGAAAGSKVAHQTATKPPGTIAARKAASALSMASKPTTALQPKPVKPVNTRPLSFLQNSRKPVVRPTVPKPSVSDATTGAAASRTTLGYNKGRTTSSMLHGRREAPNPTRTFARSSSTVSSGSDSTITPARFAQRQVKDSEQDDLRRLEFLSIFDVDEDDDGNLAGEPVNDDVDDGFQLNINF